MAIVKARCTACDGELQVNPETEQLVCKFCGSTFVVQEAINHYNTTINNNVTNNITTEQVIIHQHGEEINVPELVKKGISIITSNNFANDEDIRLELNLIIRKISKKEPSNKFLKLFNVYINPEAGLKGLSAPETDEERAIYSKIGNNIYSGIIKSIKLFYSEESGLVNDWNKKIYPSTLIASVFNLKEISLIDPSIEAKYSHVQELINGFLPKIAEEAVKSGTGYYYHKDSVDDSAFKDLCSEVESAERCVTAFRSLVDADNPVFKIGAKLESAIVQNRDVILANNYIYGIGLIDSAHKLANRNWTEESLAENSKVTHCIAYNNKYIDFYRNKIVMRFIKKDSSSEILIKKEDIMFINTHLSILKLGDTETRKVVFDIVYRLDDNSYTLVTFSQSVGNYRSYDDSAIYNTVSAYTIVNNVKHSSQDYNTNPYKQGMNGLTYVKNPNPDAEGGGCYVATCVYGSYDCPEVWLLRRYRDFYLDVRKWGRAFIKVYYKISPKIVATFGKTKLFNAINKSILDRKIKKLRAKGYQDTKYIDKY